jgi:hypothetical protein
MSLTISDIVFDEHGLTDLDGDTDNNIANLSFLTAGQTSVINALTKASFTGFPQFAQLDDFVSSTQQVNNYSLTTDGTNAFTASSAIATNLFVGANEVFLYGTSDSSVIVGRIGTGTTANASGNVAFVIALDQTKVGGVVTDASLSMAVYAPLVHADHTASDDGDTLDLTGLITLRSDFTTTTVSVFDSFASTPAGQDAFAEIAPDSGAADLLVTGFNGQTGGSSGGTEGTVNVSKVSSVGSLGTNSQAVDPGESLRVDTVTGVDFTKADTAPEVSHFYNIIYANHLETDWASFGLTQVNPGGHTATVSVFAYDAVGNAQDHTNPGGDTSNTNFPNTALAGEGTEITILPGDVQIIDASNNVLTAAQLTAQGITIATDPTDSHGVQISGLPTDYQVKFDPAADFQRFVVTNTSSIKNSTFDIGHIKVATVSSSQGHESADLGQHTIFEDDGPTVATSGTPPTVTVDETNLNTPSDPISFASLFTPNYGADGAGSLAYALHATAGTNSGLVDTATKHNVFLYMDGNDIVGLVGSSTTVADPNGQEVFRISVDSTTGEVTLDQSRSMIHGDPNAVNESLAMTNASLVTLTATATDSDGDSGTSDPVGIATSLHFLDDEPSALAPSPGNSLTVGNTTGADGTEPFNSHDSSAFTTFNPGNDGFGSFTFVGPQDTSGDYQWTWNADHTVITETFKGTNLFTVTLASDGSYTMQMLSTLPDTVLALDANKIHAGGPTSHFLDVGVTGNSTDDVLITGNPGPINASNANVGVTNGNIDSGESLKFQLYTDINHNTLIPFFGINIGTKSAGAATYHVTGVLDSDHTTVVDLGNFPVGKNGTIHVVNNALLDSITVTDVTGNAIKVGIAGISLLLPPSDESFTYNVQLKDGDGDAATGSFTVNIDGDNSGTIDNPVSPAAVISGAAAASLTSSQLTTAMLSMQTLHSPSPSDLGGRIVVPHDFAATNAEFMHNHELPMPDHLIAVL